MDELKFLKQEAEKLQRVLSNESGNNYKKYATLFQAYLTAKGNIQQLEAYRERAAEERKRKEENEKAWKEAEQEIKEGK